MRKALIILFVLASILCHSQTIHLEIDASCVIYSDFHDKAFVAVSSDDAIYSQSLIQLNPYTGDVEKNIPINGDPKKIQLTEDHSHLYVSYYFDPKIDKVSLDDFQISSAINAGEYKIIDFAVSPINENILFVVLGEGNYADKIVMYRDGVIQPRQIEDFYMWASHLCVKNDGQRLYGHNGENTGHQGYLIEVSEDGISYNGIGWEYMIRSFYEIKIHNDLVFGNKGHLVDPFSDSIPIMKAIMPVNDLTNSTPGYEYSESHGCYVYGHETDYKGYISFIHGQFYNYIGSLLVTEDTDRIYDLDVVDENHFIIITYDANPDYKHSILLYSTEDKSESVKQKMSGDYNQAWFDNIDLISLPKIKESDHFSRRD